MSPPGKDELQSYGDARKRRKTVLKNKPPIKIIRKYTTRVSTPILRTPLANITNQSELSSISQNCDHNTTTPSQSIHHNTTTPSTSQCYTKPSTSQNIFNKTKHVTNLNTTTPSQSIHHNTTTPSTSQCYTKPSTSQNIFTKTKHVTNLNTLGVNLINRFAEPSPSSNQGRKRKLNDPQTSQNDIHEDAIEEEGNQGSDNEEDYDNFDEGDSDNSADEDYDDGLTSAFEGY
jgi:hypothetical protein